jgi:hypothetical protein
MRRLAVAGLLLTTLACEGIFGNERTPPMRIALGADTVAAGFFAPGDTVNGVVMPRAGILISIPVTFQNLTVDTVWFGGCAPFYLIDEDPGAPPISGHCASILMAPASLAPLETRTEVATLAACFGTLEDSYIGGYPCHLTWLDPFISGDYRMGLDVHTGGPTHFEAYNVRSRKFTLLNLTPSLGAARAP